MMSRKNKKLRDSLAASRHTAARQPQHVEHVNAVIWDFLHQRESANTLPWLTPQFATACYEQYRRGDYAQIQLLWDQLEEYDETLATVLSARLGAIAEMPWSVVVDADAVGEDAGKQALAEAQQATLSAALARVENLEEALAHLAMADFRGVAALELVQTETGQRWEGIEPWCLARPARRGPWLYNPQAQSNPARLEGLREERVILREARPIDLPAMFLIVAKRHAIEGWDGVLEVFGVPSIFMELPPATSQEMATYYDSLMQRLVGDGRGTIPNGAKFQTVETRQNTTAPFAERAKWCNEGIITLATGGLLTVSTEAGSGTLAGNAHADSLARLCSLTARSISSCINRQWARRILEAAYPGQPILARFELAPEQEEDTTAMVQTLATLAGAGWRPSDAAVSEMVGYEVRGAGSHGLPDGQAADLPLESTELPPVANRCDRGESEVRSENQEDEQGALEEIKRLLEGALAPEAISAQARALAEGMEEALIENSCNQYQHEPGCTGGGMPADDYTHPQLRKKASVYNSNQVSQKLGVYKVQQKNIVAAARAKLPSAVQTPIEGIGEVQIYGSTVKEMLKHGAVKSSLLNGVEVPVHVEAVMRTEELVPKSRLVLDYPARKDNDPAEHIFVLYSDFTARDGQDYKARYTVHKMKKGNGAPRLYFMDCERGW